MLGATPYPLDRPGYAATPKTHAMHDAAAELGLDWRLPPLAISFAPAPGADPGIGLPITDPDYGNLHGRKRSTCRLCGECDIGCNVGAKNTLDYTYLSAAKHHGADLRTWHDVRAIRPRQGGGYEVDYVRHEGEPAGRPGATGARPLRTIACDRLVLAAGSYGTSYLLLRNREQFAGLSAALGTRFSGNGDLLAFLLHARDRSRTRPLDASRGPVITSAIRLPDAVDGVPGAGRGAYIEDGGYPAFVDWLVEAADVPHEIRRVARFAFERFGAHLAHAPGTHLSQEMSELIGTGALSVSSLPLLGMGRDVPDGVLRLLGDRLDVAWTTATSEAYFERVRKTMRRIAAVLGARYEDNPMWFRKRIITVHPVGGAPMGRDVCAGVCDPYGEVHGYPGLYIADGAALPGPVGANPSLTIAALADRMCTRLLEKGRATMKRGADLAHTGSAAGGRGNEPANGQHGRTSLSFTEEMEGFYAAGASNPTAWETMRHGHRHALAFRLTITADDIDRFLNDPEHLARAEGWIDAAGLGGHPTRVRGWSALSAKVEPVPREAAVRRVGRCEEIEPAPLDMTPRAQAGGRPRPDHPAKPTRPTRHYAPTPPALPRRWRAAGHAEPAPRQAHPPHPPLCTHPTGAAPARVHDRGGFVVIFAAKQPRS